jgi:hypothetical protein
MHPDSFPDGPSRFYFERFFFGRFFRLVLAKSLSCFSLIDSAICLEAPLSDDFDLSPRLAASAAPAAICCFLDLAGILLVPSRETWRADLLVNCDLLGHFAVGFHF